MNARMIVLCLTGVLTLGVSGCGNKKKDEGRKEERSKEGKRAPFAADEAWKQANTKIQESFGRQAAIEEEWMAILDTHAAESEIGIEKGAVFAGNHKAECKQLAKNVIAIKNDSPLGQAAFQTAMMDHANRTDRTMAMVQQLKNKYRKKKADVSTQHQALHGTFNSDLAAEAYIDILYLK